MDDTLTLKERAAQISEAANRLSDELARTGLPEPSFERGLPPALSNDASETPALCAKLELLQMVDKLHSLLTDPTLLLTAQLVMPFPYRQS